MKDELENIFRNEIEHFDEEVPEGHVDRFMEKLDRSKKTPDVWNVLKWAASILLVLGLGFGMAKWFDGDKQEVLVENTPPIQKITDNLDTYFVKKVNNKMIELQSLHIADTALVNQSVRELEVLEEEYDELKSKLEVYKGNKLIIKAMANNYRTRLKLLDVLISRLEYNMGEEQPTKVESPKRI